VSVFSQEKFIANEGVAKPLKARLDTTMTPINLTLKQKETSDFVRYSRRNVLMKSPTSDKVFIQPLSDREKSGPKFRPAAK